MPGTHKSFKPTPESGAV